MVDVKCLSDSELQYELDRLGFSPGPILPSTRKVYEKKLVQLLVSASCAPLILSTSQERDTEATCEEVNATIILKGNIIFCKVKNRGPKKKASFCSSYKERHLQEEEQPKYFRCTSRCQCFALCNPEIKPCQCLDWARMKKNPVFEEQWEDTVKPNSENKMLTKAPTSKLKSIGLSYLGRQGLRCATRVSAILGKEKCNIKEKDTLARSSRGKQELFPVSLKLAVVGILIIVVFVYITVEKKSLFQ